MYENVLASKGSEICLTLAPQVCNQIFVQVIWLRAAFYVRRT